MRRAHREGPPYSEGVRSRDIHADIKRTRAEMDLTIDQLVSRFSPRGLIKGALGAISGRDERYGRDERDDGGATALLARQTARGVGRGLAWMFREHPIPTLLLGAGIASLFFEDRENPWRLRRPGWTGGREPKEGPACPRHGGSYVDARTGEGYEPGARGPGRYEDAPPPGASEAQRAAPYEEGPPPPPVGPAGERMSRMRDIAQRTAARSAGRVSQATERVGEQFRRGGQTLRSKAEHGGERMRQQAGRAAEQARHGYERTREAISRAADESPLAVGAGALALGLLGGLLLPRTRIEDRFMGVQAERFRERGAEVGDEVIDRGAEAAEAGVEAAAENLQDHGRQH